jgi:hypothetical protein
MFLLLFLVAGVDDEPVRAAVPGPGGGQAPAQSLHPAQPAAVHRQRRPSIRQGEIWRLEVFLNSGRFILGELEYLTLQSRK